MGDQTSEIEDLERIFTDSRAEPIKISYAAIKYITKNFAQVIGDGGFGVVYLGGLRNGMVAVKKLSTSSKDFSDKQFLDEVTCLRKVNHRNIVRYLGYCADTQGEVMEVKGKLMIVEVQQRLLCFEYVPNGNLHQYLEEKTHGYKWNVRYQIIKGIVEGLHYIHQEHINHLDLKPRNVLLGANMEPKITDFGVSRCIEEQATMVTMNIFGTLGYIPPEFIDKKQISSKSDIYSFGVIMINLLTGCNEYTEDWHDAIDVECAQMVRCIEIAQTCVNRNPHDRPTTGEIIHILNETEAIIQKDHASQTCKAIITEPRNDPTSSLHQVVQRFQALPAETLQKRSRADTLYMEVDVPECLLVGSKKPGKLSYHLLRLITQNFSLERKIGQGAFGSTYKGILRQRSVAVKKLYQNITTDERMFHNEVAIAMLVRHKNILQFLGYCSYTEGEAIELDDGKVIVAEIRERLLCFEYLSNGSLDYYVSDASSGLEWKERYQIIKGICEGLHYLHGKCIAHRDLKPPNILLDDNMVPKISDFGLSGCFTENQTKTNTSARFGTMGYMAPEFLDDGVFTFKADIYSLGIIITEILSGRKNNLDAEIENVLQSWRTRMGTSSTDTIIEQVRVCAEISIACIVADPDKRPDIHRIIEMLGETE